MEREKNMKTDRVGPNPTKQVQLKVNNTHLSLSLCVCVCGLRYLKQRTPFNTCLSQSQDFSNVPLLYPTRSSTLLHWLVAFQVPSEFFLLLLRESFEYSMKGELKMKSKMKWVGLVGLVLSALSIFTHFLLARFTEMGIAEYQSSVTIFSWRPIFDTPYSPTNVINHISHKRSQHFFFFFEGKTCPTSGSAHVFGLIFPFFFLIWYFYFYFYCKPWFLLTLVMVPFVLESVHDSKLLALHFTKWQRCCTHCYLPQGLIQMKCSFLFLYFVLRNKRSLVCVPWLWICVSWLHLTEFGLEFSLLSIRSNVKLICF